MRAAALVLLLVGLEGAMGWSSHNGGFLDLRCSVRFGR
jgi:hypothetical protein